MRKEHKTKDEKTMISQYIKSIMTKICNYYIDPLITENEHAYGKANIQKFSEELNLKELSKEILKRIKIGKIKLKNGKEEKLKEEWMEKYHFDDSLWEEIIQYHIERVACYKIFAAFEKAENRIVYPPAHKFPREGFDKDIYINTASKFQYKVNEKKLLMRIKHHCEEIHLQYEYEFTRNRPSKSNMIYVYDFEQHKYNDYTKSEYSKYVQEQEKTENSKMVEKAEKIDNTQTIHNFTKNNLIEDKQFNLATTIDFSEIHFKPILSSNGKLRTDCGGYNNLSNCFTGKDAASIAWKNKYGIEAHMVLNGLEDLLLYYYPHILDGIASSDGRKPFEKTQCVLGGWIAEDDHKDEFNVRSIKLQYGMKLILNGTGKERKIVPDREATNDPDFKLQYDEEDCICIEQTDSYTDYVGEKRSQFLRHKKAKRLIEKDAFLLIIEHHNTTDKTKWKYMLLCPKDLKNQYEDNKEIWNNTEGITVTFDEDWLSLEEYMELLHIYCLVLNNKLSLNYLEKEDKENWFPMIRESYGHWLRERKENDKQ